MYVSSYRHSCAVAVALTMLLATELHLGERLKREDKSGQEGPTEIESVLTAKETIPIATPMWAMGDLNIAHEHPRLQT